jgi:3-dehydroquinate dehydratase-2
MKTFLMLHGINHNMFGKRDPKQYGTTTLAEIDGKLQALAEELGVKVASFQTNSEGEMCDRIHQAYKDNVDGVMLNAGAWTHYSYGIRDALAILTVPVISSTCRTFTHARSSVISRSSSRLFWGRSGFGVDSYLLALRAAVSASAGRNSSSSGTRVPARRSLTFDRTNSTSHAKYCMFRTYCAQILSDPRPADVVDDAAVILPAHEVWEGR